MDKQNGAAVEMIDGYNMNENQSEPGDHFSFHLIVHAQNLILSFTSPHVVPNLYDFLSSVERKIRYFKER